MKLGLCRGLVVIALAFTASAAISQQLIPTKINPDLGSPRNAGEIESEFVGSYCPDGLFKKAGCPQRSGDEEGIRRGGRPAEVPPGVDLHPIESVVEDYAPPARALRVSKGSSTFASVRDRILTALYGRESVLRAPTHVTADSRRRLILSDPEAVAIHVLDGKQSFRIQGGPGRRLQHPNGLAVDDRDNIYVADGKLGMILVYDPRGHFLRYIGNLQGESMFQDPTGIAIARAAGRLYVLDSAANELAVLDLRGHVVKRVGSRRPQPGISFEYPTEVAVGGNAVVVLDMYGSRIQVLDLQFGLLNSFKIANLSGPRVQETALALDAMGNIYVSYAGASVKIYQQNGRVVGYLGRPEGAQNELSATSGAWIDGQGTIYLADSRSSRVRVFRLTSKAAASRKTAVTAAVGSSSGLTP